MDFEVIGKITGAETFAEGRGIRDLPRLLSTYGGRNWRKRKGFALVRLLETGETRHAEVHWYEAHGIGKKEMKVKR
ncbi:MAG: hypothetical protein LBU43_06455 [Candidatus Accumulibacter sp.]|jgi:hypothetical protein|nr:hypothetical protein [Accumulibacter sp.]